MALTQGRNTEEKLLISNEFFIPVKADTKIYEGSLVVIENGYAIPGKEATDIIPVGRAQQFVDNTGGLADKTIRVKKGCFKWNNDTSNSVSEEDLFKNCYIVDDCTVSISDNSKARTVAGKVVGVENDGVWVVTE
jgi:hypothetical protein